METRNRGGPRKRSLGRNADGGVGTTTYDLRRSRRFDDIHRFVVLPTNSSEDEPLAFGRLRRSASRHSSSVGDLWTAVATPPLCLGRCAARRRAPEKAAARPPQSKTLGPRRTRRAGDRCSTQGCDRAFQRNRPARRAPFDCGQRLRWGSPISPFPLTAAPDAASRGRAPRTSATATRSGRPRTTPLSRRRSSSRALRRRRAARSGRRPC